MVFAHVSAGSLQFTIDEAAYRLRSYLPAFDALPTKEEYLQNGGKLAQRRVEANRPKAALGKRRGSVKAERIWRSGRFCRTGRC
jgi:hypothetical protein